MNIMGQSNAAVKIYQLNYLVGFGIGGIGFFITNYFFKPPGTDMSEPFDDWVTAPLEIEAAGSQDESASLETPTKGAAFDEKVVAV